MKKLTFALIAGIALCSSSQLIAQDDEAPAHQPDLILKGKGEPKGDDIYGRPAGQTIRNKTKGPRPVRFTIGVQNDGTEDDRIRVRGTGSDRKFRVGYKIGGRNVSAAMRRGLPLALEAGEAQRIKAGVKATRITKGRNARKALRYSAASSGDRTKRDSALSLVLKQKAGREA